MHAPVELEVEWGVELSPSLSIHTVHHLKYAGQDELLGGVQQPAYTPVTLTAHHFTKYQQIDCCALLLVPTQSEETSVHAFPGKVTWKLCSLCPWTDRANVQQMWLEKDCHGADYPVFQGAGDRHHQLLCTTLAWGCTARCNKEPAGNWHDLRKMDAKPTTELRAFGKPGRQK